jgi:hypothetical protein
MYYNTLYLRNSSDEILVLGHTEITEITESFACGEKMSHRLHRVHRFLVGRRFRSERSERRNLHRSTVNFNVNAFFATEAYADLQRITTLSSITPLRARDSVWHAFTCETTIALARPNGMEGTLPTPPATVGPPYYDGSIVLSR